MADTPAKNEAKGDEAFLREVDEAVRRSDLDNFLRRYGWWLLGLVVAGLLAFGGWIIWQNQQRKDAGAVAQRYIQAMDEAAATAGQPAAVRAFEDFDDGGVPIYAGAAKMMQANMLVAQGKGTEAAKIYGELSADSSLPQAIRDLALLKQVTASFDTLAPQTVVDRLKPLAVPGTPWFPSAAELSALAYIRLGKTDVAGRLFADIAREPGAPESLVSRARQMAGVLGIDAVQAGDNAGAANAASAPYEGASTNNATAGSEE